MLLSRHLPVATEENHESVGKGSRCVGRYSNSLPLVTAAPPRSVISSSVDWCQSGSFFMFISLKQCCRNSTMLVTPIYNYRPFIDTFWRNSPTRARATSFLKFLDHTQLLNTVCMTPLDEGPARHKDLYLTVYKTHNRQTPRLLGWSFISLIFLFF